jgi:hypothetical protein
VGGPDIELARMKREEEERTVSNSVETSAYILVIANVFHLLLSLVRNCMCTSRRGCLFVGFVVINCFCD